MVRLYSLRFRIAKDQLQSTTINRTEVLKRLFKNG